MDVIFILDIVVTFNSGYYKKGVKILDRRWITFNYLKSWFLIDVLASFPYNYTVELILTDDPNSSVSSLAIAPRLLRMIKIVKFLRILRLLRVLKLKRVLYKLEEYLVTDFLFAVMDGIKLLSILLLINHIMACIFYFIGTYEDEYNPDNWVNSLGLMQLSKMERYLVCFYFAFTTISGVGYGDIRPYTNIERVYCMGCMVIATGTSAYLIGALNTIFNRSSMLSKEMKLKSLHINQFLLHHDIPNSLRARILSYLDFLIEHKRKHKLNENQVLELLNETLREQVIANLNGRILNDCKLFDQFDMMFISEIIFILERKLFVMNDTIFEENEQGSKMFFIAKGTVILLHLKTHTYIKQLGENSSFGQAAFFSSKPRCCTVRTNSFAEMLVLNLVDFHKVLNSHEQDEEIYNRIHRKIDKENDLSDI